MVTKDCCFSSYLEFTKCYFSEYVFSYILLNQGIKLSAGNGFFKRFLTLNLASCDAGKKLAFMLKIKQFYLIFNLAFQINF